MVVAFVDVFRGTEEYFGIDGEVDVINSTLGKALGGASGTMATRHAASRGVCYISYDVIMYLACSNNIIILPAIIH